MKISGVALILILVIVLGGAATGGYFYRKHKETPCPPASTSPEYVAAAKSAFVAYALNKADTSGIPAPTADNISKVASKVQSWGLASDLSSSVDQVYKGAWRSATDANVYGTNLWCSLVNSDTKPTMAGNMLSDSGAPCVKAA